MPYNTLLSLDDANVSASPSSQNEKFNGPTAPLRNETWLLPDYSPGIWDIELDYRFTPSRMMLRNPPVDNSTYKQYGTKTFSFATVPEDASGGPVGLGIAYQIYKPAQGLLSNTEGNCTGSCGLPPDNVWTELTFHQNFSISAFRLVIAEWFGNAGGLNGLQLYGHIDERNVRTDTSTAANGTESAAPSPSRQPFSAGLSGGAIAGVVVACVAAIGFLAVGFWFRRRKPRQAHATEFSKVADDGETFAPAGGRHELDTTRYDVAKYAAEAHGGELVEMEALHGKAQAKEMGVEGSTVHEMPAEVRTAEMNGHSVVPEMDAGSDAKLGERK